MRAISADYRRGPPSRRRAGLALILLLATGLLSAAAAANELGRPVVRDFPPGRSNIPHLSPAVTQDADGVIYVAGSHGVSYYDGISWRPLEFPTESAGIRKFATTADGTIYMGGASVIGHFRGSGETAEYVSLAGRLPPAALGYDEIHDVLAVGQTVYFADEEKILIWRDRTFTVVRCPTPPRSRGARLHRVGTTVYVTGLDRPLRRLVNDRLEVVADDPVFRQSQIILIEAGPANSLGVLTADRGVFRFADGRLAPADAEATRWLAGKVVLRAQRLGDGSLVVAFTAVSGDGGMRFAADGRYLGPIDNSLGLYVKTIRDFFTDREGGLWLGTETGVFRLEWPSPVTVFDAINGLGSGAVADVARHEGVLYAATSEGVFRLLPVDAAGRCARFERVFGRPAYALLSHPAGLLVAGYNEVLIQSPAGFAAIATYPPEGGTLQHSSRDPDRVWINTSGGVRSIRHTAAGWRAEESHPASDDSPGPATETSASASPALPMLVKDTAGAIARIRTEKNSASHVRWICGAKGLVRVDETVGFRAPVPLATRLRAAEVREGDRLAPSHRTLNFSFVALRHQLANSVTYQTRLVGFDEDWSEWTPKRERAFTSLQPSSYRFEVRARDADGHLSAPSTLSFTVLAPWWRTWWALLGYTAMGTGLFATLVRLRTRTLRARAAKLENLVTERTQQLAQRTSELAQKNVELTRLHQLELDEKTAARLSEEKARLEVLRYQLNPHFLFNTLASISSALPTTQSTARTMVERLANFCRLTLHRADDHEWTTLGEEMRLLRVYLEIEQSRWGDLLDVAIDCDPALEAERLPHFLLLPLVENALKYGRATSPDRVGLRLAARREARSGTASRSEAPGSPSTDGTEIPSEATGDVLILEVSNTGTWIEPTEKKTVSSLGIGLDNLRERLTRYYPRSHNLTLAHADGWVTVTLRLAARYPETGDNIPFPSSLIQL